MSSKKRSTPKRDTRRKPAARSLESIAPKRRAPAPPDDDDDDVPAIELPGMPPAGRRGPFEPIIKPIPSEASADMRQALLALEWAAARGMSLSSVTHGPVTIGVAAMGQSRGVRTADIARASSQLYRDYGGEALERELRGAGTADDEDQE